MSSVPACNWLQGFHHSPFEMSAVKPVMWVMWSRQRPWWCHVHPEPSSRCPYHHHFVGKQWLLDKYQCQRVWCCCATSDAIVPLQIQQLEGNICDNFAYFSFFSLPTTAFCAESSSKVRSTCRGFPTEASITCLQYNPQPASIDLPWKIQHHFYQIQLLNSIYLTFWLVLDVVWVHNHQDLISDLLAGRTSSTHSGESPTNPKSTAGGRLP